MNLLLNTIILRVLVLKVLTVSTTQLKHLLPKPDAAKECARSGTSLLNFRDLQENPSTQEFLEQLEDGQTAWIDGYAEISPFLWREGCYLISNTKYEAKFEMTNKSVFACFNECLLYRTKMFGVQNTTCYCFKNGMFNVQKLVENALCNIPCDYNAIDSCGGDLYLALYSVYSDGGIHWGKNEPSKKQCAYITGKHPQPEASTASCHSFSASGYVCTGALRNTYMHCDNPVIDFCISEGTLTWQEAYNSCLNTNGIRSDWIHLINYGRGIKYNQSYWFGPYRTFRISETIIGKNTVCVAAIRSNNTLYVEPDDCSEMKYSLCKPKVLQNVRFNLESKVTMPSKVNQSDSLNITRHRRNTETVDLITEYVPHLLSGSALLLSVIVIIVVCRQQKSFKREVLRLHSTSETAEDYITL